MCQPSWEELLARPKFADLVIIATMDRDHFAPAMAAIEKGYDLLLEKPISATPEECCAIARAAQEKGVFVLVCHVLRFTPFFGTLKAVVDSGRLGEIMHIQHAEGVGNLHQAHSFVRGNWRNSEESSCMILQKTCHDMDILQWLIGKPCRRVHSFGSLSYFKKENMPSDAAARCLDCPRAETCVYSAVRFYRNEKYLPFIESATHKRFPSEEDVLRMLRTTDYGRCVFDCPNNVVDHQTVNLEFEGGTTASVTMCAFNRGGRDIRIMGTRGELTANMADKTLRLYNFETRSFEEIEVVNAYTDDTIAGGHGGGDTGIMIALRDALNGNYVGNSICSIQDTCRNHLISFAAEESRLTGRVVDLEEMERRMGGIAVN
jgi:predicted dehydrogenase